jgi:translation elongation factor EF-Tu-like GTPase
VRISAATKTQLAGAQRETRGVLGARVGFDGDTTPIVRMSGLGALRGEPLWTQRVVDLLRAVDEHVPVPLRPVERPFLMPIENVLTISGRGTVVTGAIEQGALAVGSPVEVVGLGPTRGQRLGASGVSGAARIH